MNSIEWKQIVNTQKGITKDKALRAKLFLKISARCGHAFSDMAHFNLVDARLEDKLNRLAKRHHYITNGFTCYQAWVDKS